MFTITYTWSQMKHVTSLTLLPPHLLPRYAKRTSGVKRSRGNGPANTTTLKRIVSEKLVALALFILVNIYI